MMFFKFVVVAAAVTVSLGVSTFGQAHVPAQGSAERKAIIEGLRAEWKRIGQSEGTPYRGTITFDVKYIKSNGPWAWVYAEPRSTNSHDSFGENSGFLLRQGADGRWKVQELPPQIEDPDDPENLDYPTAKDVARIRKMHKGLPADIFPVIKGN